VAEFRFDKCLEQIFARLDSLNVAIDTAKPWELAKTNPVKAVEFLSAMAGELTQVASALVPFLPETSQKISVVFNAGKIVPSPQVLFPRID
jgi:methionyl-tRNA synthetase